MPTASMAGVEGETGSASMAGAEGEEGGALIAVASLPENFYRSREKACRAPRACERSACAHKTTSLLSLLMTMSCAQKASGKKTRAVRVVDSKSALFNFRHGSRLPCMWRTEKGVCQIVVVVCGALWCSPSRLRGHVAARQSTI
jgi:hypothetical protein